MYELPDLRYQKIKRNKSELIKHMNEFKLEPKFSVGIWYFTPGGNRFHEPVLEQKSVEARIQMAYELADLGVDGIEAHYPDEINWNNIDKYKDLEKDTGIKVVGVPFSHFYDKKFEFGALSNPNEKIRNEAIDIAINGLKIVKEIGANCAISWPGMDGYMYDLGTIYPWMWEFYDESVAKAMDEVPGVRIALEPKPYEPAINNIFRTTAEGILASQRIQSLLTNPENKKLIDKGHQLFGLNPEIGHVRMGYESLGAAYSLVGMYGMLAHTHWNSQPLGNYDQDLNVGVVEVTQTYALLYALKMMGYHEFFGIDINPEHMPSKTAIELNIKAIKKLNEKIETLPHDEIIQSYLKPTQHRGKIEDILIK
ncbi:MAG: TIM barrel protein, partial [Candidatus Lokiarchaeota archaeon]|nr:TIM barrel protein [Candidatus Lokiarchaeota archaeon]